MKLSTKKQLLLLGFGLIVFSAVFGFLLGRGRNIYRFPYVQAKDDTGTTDITAQAILPDDTLLDFVSKHRSQEGRTNFADKKLIIDEDFKSHLPLVVIDTNGITPEKSTVWDDEKKYAVSITDDPFVKGTMQIINNSDGLNCLTDTPETTANMQMRVRGNSSCSYDKKQWLIKLLNENGKSRKEDLLNMGSDNEWILNISFVDKSLIRNYLVYQAAGSIMGYAPESTYCEVVWKNGDTYEYQGLYLLMHSVKVSKDRVNLPKYAENSKYIPALLRRDRYSDSDIILNNYGTENGLTKEFIGLEYPGKDVISEESIQKITNRISEFEKALYADTYEELIKYRDYVDMDSFADYFIINEFFSNYDAGYHSTYFYTDYEGKIHMGPVWDFDQAIDNSSTHSLNYYTTAFHSAPWFDQMLRDPQFTQLIVRRYAELRKSILSDEALSAYAHEVSEMLGSAIDRDWARWGYYYTGVDYLTELSINGNDRNTLTQEAEVERILEVLSTHGAWLDENIDSLFQFKMISLEDSGLIEKSLEKDYRSLMAVVFVFVFLLSGQLVLRHESEY